MAELNYSLEARNVLNKFHGVDNVVYVEGDDDVAFWEFLFEKFSEIKVKLEESGGKEALRSRIQEVVEGQGSFYVAVDSDFDVLLEDELHPRVLRTFGYSIENTIISDVVLQKVISRVAGVSKAQVPASDCAAWMEQVEQELRPLVMADAFNRLSESGVQVLTDNCDRFLVSRNSSDFCPRKINAHLDSLGLDFDLGVEEHITAELEARDMLWRDLLRGHFYFSAVFRFVKRYIALVRSAVSISKEMFFGSLMLAFESSFDSQHRHYEYYMLMFSRGGQGG